MLKHLLINRAGYDITWGEVLPHRIVLVHKRRVVRVYQSATIPTNRFSNQETCAICTDKCGRMELHKLHVDDAGSGTVRHRLAIPTGAKRIRIVRVNLPEATGCKHGRTRHHLSHLTRPPVMEVGPHTCERSVNL